MSNQIIITWVKSDNRNIDFETKRASSSTILDTLGLLSRQGYHIDAIVPTVYAGGKGMAIEMANIIISKLPAPQLGETLFH